jgi:hypothetical protein
MSFTNYALDTFFAQHISELTKCEAPNLSEELGLAESWDRNFILNSIFRINIDSKFKPFMFGIIRRVHMAFFEYQDGRKALLEYLGGHRDRISTYFRALYHFELVTMLLYQAYEYERKVSEKNRFEENDGSPLERLHKIYTESKHPGTPSEIAEGYLYTVWLTNSGIASKSAVLSWEELADLARKEGKIADNISNLPRLQKSVDGD